MRNSQKFYRCNHCGNMLGMIDNKGVPVVCCGERMAELKPNTVEASTEKHLPVVAFSGDELVVSVGSTLHPMEDKHSIVFVYVETERGGQRKCMTPGGAPKAVFRFHEDKPVAVYAYCNLHGLWKTKVH